MSIEAFLGLIFLPALILFFVAMFSKGRVSDKATNIAVALLVIFLVVSLLLFFAEMSWDLSPDWDDFP